MENRFLSKNKISGENQSPQNNGQLSNKNMGGTVEVRRAELTQQTKTKANHQEKAPAILGQDLPPRLFHVANKRVAFLVGVGQGTSDHHEPPKYEVKEAGLAIDEYSIIETDLAGHAKLHMERYRLFKNENDRTAAEALIKRMSPAQKQKFGEVEKSEEITKSVRAMILERVELFGLE